MLNWNRAGMTFNLHLLKIHFLFLKLLIIKEFSSFLDETASLKRQTPCHLNPPSLGLKIEARLCSSLAKREWTSKKYFHPHEKEFSMVYKTQDKGVFLGSALSALAAAFLLAGLVFGCLPREFHGNSFPSSAR